MKPYPFVDEFLRPVLRVVMPRAPRQNMKLVMCPLFVFLLFATITPLLPAPAAAQHAGPPEPSIAWVTYRDPTFGFSFAHPATLRVVPLRPTEFHIAGLIQAVQLVDDTDSSPILRVLVKDTVRDPKASVQDEAFLRKTCKTLETLSVSGRRGFSCVSCGSASCAWRVVVPGNREFTLFTMDPQESLKPRPEDGRYPLLSIIRSFRIEDEANPGSP